MQRGANFNPFPGLRPFETEEYDLFFGRADQTKELLDRLSTMRFVAVVGSSGSGKSSLVRAGLVPLLWGGRLPHAGAQWRVALLRPGDNPIHSLAGALCAGDVLGKSADSAEDAIRDETLLEVRLRRSGLGLVEVVRLARIPEGQNLLIIVDQFEELFRFAETPGRQEDAAAFVKLLLEALRQPELPIYVVLTMRSDFIGDCARFRDLAETVAAGLYLIPRMTREQRRAAIEEPVRVANGTIARRLVTRVLNDAGDDPDQLPIMQHALMRTWDRWSAHEHADEPLDLADYEAVGGMALALSRHADEAYDALDVRGQEIARRMFQRLTAKGADHREVRRAANVSTLLEVTGASKDELARVISEFRKPGRSFLMPPESVSLDEDPPIDISHESLIRRWDRLAKWVEEESEAAKVYQRLAETARLHAQGRAGLWNDPDLSSSLAWKERVKPTPEWARRYDLDFDQAMAFLEKSRAERDADARRKKLRQRGGMGVLIGGMAILAIFAVLAWQAKKEAIDARGQEAAAREDNAQIARLARRWLFTSIRDHLNNIDDALSWAPPSWSSYLHRQRAYWRTQADDREHAAEDSDFAITQQPDYMPARLGRSELYLVEGQADHAATEARIYLDTNATDPGGYLMLGLSEATLGQYREAAQHIERCFEMCTFPTLWSESVLSPDLQEFTAGFKSEVRDSDFLLALRYTQAFLYALAGDDRFAKVLQQADDSDRDWPRSTDAYVAALNWQWLIVRGQAMRRPAAGVENGADEAVADYAAYALRGALWDRIAATHTRFKARAQSAFAKFQSVHERRRDQRYASVAKWVEAAKRRNIEPVAWRPSIEDSAFEKQLEADYLELVRAATNDPMDMTPALAKLTEGVAMLQQQQPLGRRGEDVLVRLLLARARLRAQVGDKGGASTDANTVLGIRKNVPEAYNVLASVATSPADQIASYQQALNMDPYNPTALDGLSKAVEQDDPKLALVLLHKRRLVRQPWSDDYARLARLQAQLDDLDDARENLETAIAMAPWRLDLYGQRKQLDEASVAQRRWATGLGQAANARAATGDDALALELYVKAFSELSKLATSVDSPDFDLEALMRSTSDFMIRRAGVAGAAGLWRGLAQDPALGPTPRGLANREYERMKRVAARP